MDPPFSQDNHPLPEGMNYTSLSRFTPPKTQTRPSSTQRHSYPEYNNMIIPSLSQEKNSPNRGYRYTIDNPIDICRSMLPGELDMYVTPTNPYQPLPPQPLPYYRMPYQHIPKEMDGYPFKIITKQMCGAGKMDIYPSKDYVVNSILSYEILTESNAPD